jgi:hypothetical protein
MAKKKNEEEQFVEVADDVIEMWANGDYEDVKDAILDAQGLLDEMPAHLAPVYQARLEAIVAAAKEKLR